MKLTRPSIVLNMGGIKALLFLSVFVLIQGCEQNLNESIKLRALEVSNDLIDMSESLLDSNSFMINSYQKKFSYYGDSNFEYILPHDLENNIFVVNSDTFRLVFDDKREYFIRDKAYVVKRFLSTTLAIDGEVVHFISDDFGLLLRKSTTWNTSVEIIHPTLDTDNLLRSIIYNDVLFFQGNNKVELPPPPPPPLNKD
jgi:hypothetical protein